MKHKNLQKDVMEDADVAESCNGMMSKETDYYEKSYGSCRNSDFRDTQVDIKG